MNQEENFLFLKIIYALTFNKNLILHFFFLLVAFFFIPFCPTCFSLHGTRRVTFLEFIGHPQWSPQEPPDFSVGRLLKLLKNLCHNHVSPESIALRRIEWAQRTGLQCSIRSRTKTFLPFVLCLGFFQLRPVLLNSCRPSQFGRSLGVRIEIQHKYLNDMVKISHDHK